MTELSVTLASMTELSVIQNMETACRFGRAQSAAWPHVAGERGSLQIIKDEVVKINRDRRHQCVGDQISEFAGRHKNRRGGGYPSRSNRPRARNRKRSRSPHKSSPRGNDPMRRRGRRNRPPRDKKDTTSSKYNYPAGKKEDDHRANPKKGGNYSGFV